nr:saccharopine dehydrogenase NADP-binding domain-containing protein [Paenibacillus sp. 1001270B_150601_E10]
MKVCCLGDAGKIAREAVLDLVQSYSVEKITIADFSVTEGQKVVAWLNDPREDFVQVDVRQTEETAYTRKSRFLMKRKSQFIKSSAI